MEPDAIDRVLAATQADLFWVPDHVGRIDRPDVLALHDGGPNDLTNQVVRTSAADAAIPDLIREIAPLHPQVSQWLVVPGQNREALERHLPEHGYGPEFEGDAFSVDANSTWSEGAFRVVQVHDLATLRDNIDATDRGFGRSNREHDYARELALCTGRSARTARFVAYAADGSLAGSANINRHPEVAFGFLWAGSTLPDHRGRGVYRALLGARCRWAAANGLTRVGLYASRETSGPVVARIGFDRHGPMAHWQRPAPAK